MPRTAKLPYNPEEAVAALSAADPKLARLIQRAGPFTLRLRSTQTPFEALLRAIIYQQLHGKAAATIHQRLLDSFAPVAGSHPRTGETIHFTAQHLLDAPNEQLRAAGLSHNKALAVRDLAAKTLDGTVPTLARIRRMSDEAIIEHLTQVRGVGRWTVEMFLMFRLGRPDILPTSDFGVRRGFALTFGTLKPPIRNSVISTEAAQRRSGETRISTAVKPIAGTRITPADLPTPAVMEKRAQRWQPWRSVASWYLWRACDLADGKLPSV